jgi:hypothetical protein
MCIIREEILFQYSTYNVYFSLVLKIHSRNQFQFILITECKTNVQLSPLFAEIRKITCRCFILNSTFIHVQCVSCSVVVQFKTQRNNKHILRHRNEMRYSPPMQWTLPNFLVALKSSLLLLGCLYRQLRRSSAGASRVYSLVELVFVLEHTSHRRRFLLFVKV